jgi:hypothetical protein
MLLHFRNCLSSPYRSLSQTFSQLCIGLPVLFRQAICLGAELRELSLTERDRGIYRPDGVVVDLALAFQTIPYRSARLQCRRSNSHAT